MSGPEEQEVVAAALPELPLLSLDILQTIRSAQAQHGLRHGDYGRYRQYCSRRLRRLYKSTKFLHGRGRFAKKKMEPNMVADARFLAIPLLSAERAWAMAMEIKGQLAAGPEAPKRMHLQRRLWKAAAWGAELTRLATERFDARTRLEAEAYASWLRGSALLEKEMDWQAALAALLRAKKLWDELARVGSLEGQAATRAQLQEVETAVRFCSYRLGRAEGADSADLAADLLASADAGASELLGGQLAALAKEQQASESAGTDSFTWRGTTYELPSEAARIAVHTAAELSSQLDTVGTASPMETDQPGQEAAGGAPPLEQQLAALDKLANSYDTARAAAAEAATADLNGKAADWKSLATALRGAAMETALRRVRLQAAEARARFERTLQRSLPGARGPKGKDKERVGRPEELVRLEDSAAALVAEQSEVAAQLGGVSGEALLDATAAQAAGCQAARCYYVAHTHLAAGRRPEAAALFQRTLEHVQTAVDRHQECEQPDHAALAELQQLRRAAAAFRVAAHAGAAAEQERLAGDVAGVSLAHAADERQQEQQGFLVDNLSSTASFAGRPGGRDARIAPLVPALQAVPVRPIVLDSAREYIQPPSLEHRVEKQPVARSLTSRLFGWS